MLGDKIKLIFTHYNKMCFIGTAKYILIYSNNVLIYHETFSILHSMLKYSDILTEY